MKAACICDAGIFVRTICPEPCGFMHSYCTQCGMRQDACAHDECPICYGVSPNQVSEIMRRLHGGHSDD